jgi:hypothetical protein
LGFVGEVGGNDDDDDAPANLREAADRAGIRLGRALSPDVLLNEPVDRFYVDPAGSEFNYITPEHGLRWAGVQPDGLEQWNGEQGDAALAFAERNDQPVKWHVLLWIFNVPYLFVRGLFRYRNTALAGESALRFVITRLPVPPGACRFEDMNLQVIPVGEYSEAVMARL